MSKLSRWFPTIHAVIKKIENFDIDPFIPDKKWIKRILFLALLSGIVNAEKINWNHPFMGSAKELTGKPYLPHVLIFNQGAFISFILFIVFGAIAWSFWDEYQKKNQN